MDLGDERGLFEIPEEVAYLNCAYMSPQLRSVREVGESALVKKSRPWEITSGDFFDGPEEARSLFAELVQGDAEGVAIVPSVSYALAVAAANVNVAGGESIVLLEEQFPSNVYPWRDLARKTGAEIITVARPADHDWTATVLEHMDARCAVVAVPNCHWTDGSLLDLVRVGEAARRVGAALVVDATQSLGAYPLNVPEVRPDFLVSAAYKWLLGPYSLGFMYVGEGYREGVPLEQTWLGREGSEDFATLVEYRDSYAPGARRYDVGERSNFVALPMATEAMRQLLTWGVENVAENLSGLTGLVEAEATERGMRAIPAQRRAGHMIGLGLDPAAPGDLAARLAGEGVFVSVRGRSLRVSPHVYNTEKDVKKLFEALSRHLP